MPRVAVFLINYPLWCAPSVLNAINVLAERGYTVDIFTDSKQPSQFVHNGDLPIQVHVLWGQSDIEGKRIPNISFSSSADLGRNRGQTPRLGLKTLRSVLRKLKTASGWKMPHANIIRCIHEAWMVSRRSGPYTCFIGVEIYGLIAAAITSKLRGVPIIYWSLELWPWQQSRRGLPRIKRVVEYLCQRRAEFTIIQDEDRANFIANGNGALRSTRFTMVPATARGSAYPERNNYFRAKFGIPDSRKILLHSGSIASWGHCLELAAAAQTWPEDWVLVLHGFGESHYIDAIRRQCLVPGRVHLSLDVVPYDQIDQLVSSADVGLAFYEDLGPNWSLIGSASGKLSHYLKCGLPVITSNFPSLQRVVDAYRCGICVSSPAQTSDAMREIINDYTTYSANAIRCYEQKLSFDNYFEQVVNHLDGLHAGLVNRTTGSSADKHSIKR